MHTNLINTKLANALKSTDPLEQLDTYILNINKLQTLTTHVNTLRHCNYITDTATNECVIKGPLLTCLQHVSTELDIVTPKQVVDNTRGKHVNINHLLFLDVIYNTKYVYMNDNMRKLKRSHNWFYDDYVWGFGFLIVYMMGLSGYPVAVSLPELGQCFTFYSLGVDRVKKTFILHNYTHDSWGVLVQRSDMVLADTVDMYCDTIIAGRMNVLAKAYMPHITQSAFNEVYNLSPGGIKTFTNFYTGRYTENSYNIQDIVYMTDGIFKHVLYHLAMTLAMIRPYSDIELQPEDLQVLMTNNYITYRFIVVRIYNFLNNIYDKSGWVHEYNEYTETIHRTYLINVLDSTTFILGSRDKALLNTVHALIFKQFLVNEQTYLLNDIFTLEHANFLRYGDHPLVYSDTTDFKTILPYVQHDYVTLELLFLIFNTRHIPRINLLPFYYLTTWDLSKLDISNIQLTTDALFRGYDPTHLRYHHWVILLKYKVDKHMYYALLVIAPNIETIMFFDLHNAPYVWKLVQHIVVTHSQYTSHNMSRYNLVKMVTDTNESFKADDHYTLYYLLLCMQVKNTDYIHILRFYLNNFNYTHHATQVYNSVFATANILMKTPLWDHITVLNTPILTNWSNINLDTLPFDWEINTDNMVSIDNIDPDILTNNITILLQNTDISQINTNPRHILRLPVHHNNPSSVLTRRDKDALSALTNHTAIPGHADNNSPYKHVVIHIDNLTCNFTKFLLDCKSADDELQLQLHHKYPAAIRELITCVKICALASAGYVSDKFHELICEHGRQYKTHTPQNAANDYLWKNKKVTRMLIVRPGDLVAEDIQLFIDHPLIELIIIRSASGCWCMYRVRLYKPVHTQAVSMINRLTVPHQSYFNISISWYSTDEVSSHDYISVHQPSHDIFNKIIDKDSVSQTEIQSLSLRRKLKMNTMAFLDFDDISLMYLESENRTQTNFLLKNNRLCKTDNSDGLVVGVFIDTLTNYQNYQFMLHTITDNLRVLVFTKNYILYIINYKKTDMTVYQKQIHSIEELPKQLKSNISKRWSYSSVTKYQQNIMLTI
jgi:hypothetical protein